MIIYAICLAVGLLFTLISAVAGHFFGGGHEGADLGTGGHAEAGFDDSGVPGISFFSPTVLSSFITAFGAFGLVFTQVEATKSVWASAPLAALCGAVVAGGTFWIFNAIFERTQSSSESRLSTVVGISASVITPIPVNGVGEIAYVQGATRYTAPARTAHNAVVNAGEVVKIVRIVGTQFYVEPQPNAKPETKQT